MLSPDSRQSRSFPNINAFPGGSECKSNKTGQSKKGSKRSMKGRRKGSQDRFSQADMNITDTAAIEVEPSESVVSPLLRKGRKSNSRKRDKEDIIACSDDFQNSLAIPSSENEGANVSKNYHSKNRTGSGKQTSSKIMNQADQRHAAINANIKISEIA